MEQIPSAESPKKRTFPWKWVLLPLVLVGLGVWLWLTPAGFWGKLGAIGYSVCHQIAERSFQVHSHKVPLCARCTGMYLGAVLGVVFQFVQGKKSAYPPLRTILVMALFVLAFGLDGVNSYLHFFPGIHGLYEPSNTLRLITGMGMGLAISVALVPAFNQVIWTQQTKTSGIASWKQLGVLIGLAALLVLAVLTQSPWVIAPMGVVSGLGVVGMLMMIYSMVWAMLLHKENSYANVQQMAVPLLGGFLMTLLQLGIFALARYLITGTWDGFDL